MKNLYTILAIALTLSTQLSCAQWGSKTVKGNENVIEETRTLSGYTEIEISGAFAIELVEGTPGKISIVAESNLLEHIITQVDKDELTIEVAKKTNLQPTEQIKIVVPFEELEKLSKSGSGTLVTKKIIETDKFSLNSSGSTQMELAVNASKYIDIFKSGSGVIQMNGKTDKLSIKSSGSGNFEAEELAADDVDIKLTGSSDIRLQCKDKLKAKVSGSGNVYYSGSPSKINTKISGSGKIVKL